MNVKEITEDGHGTLAHYVESALPLTLATIWIIVAFQSKHLLPSHVNFWTRLAWPILLSARFFGVDLYPAKEKKEAENQEADGSINVKIKEATHPVNNP